MSKVQVTKTEMQAKLQGYLDDGLNNQQIADALNEEYNATEETKVNSTFVSKLKSDLGMKNAKPRKKTLFNLIETFEDTVPPSDYEEGNLGVPEDDMIDDDVVQ